MFKFHLYTIQAALLSSKSSIGSLLDFCRASQHIFRSAIGASVDCTFELTSAIISVNDLEDLGRVRVKLTVSAGCIAASYVISQYFCACFGQLVLTRQRPDTVLLAKKVHMLSAGRIPCVIN